MRKEITITELPITGIVPGHFEGRYIRTGPNPIMDPDPATYHWFLGTGMVHGVRLRDGGAEWYRNRYVRSAEVAAILGEPSRPGSVHAGIDFAANTNVIEHAGRTFVLVEGGPNPYELTYDLDTVGPRTSTARSKAVTRLIPCATQRPGSCTRSPTFSVGGTESSTRSSAPTGARAASSTSSAPVPRRCTPFRSPRTT